jgi:hypothetical protein
VRMRIKTTQPVAPINTAELIDSPTRRAWTIKLMYQGEFVLVTYFVFILFVLRYW